jgi:hypothetical protein
MISEAAVYEFCKGLEEYNACKAISVEDLHPLPVESVININ